MSLDHKTAAGGVAVLSAARGSKRKKEEKRKEVINRDSELEKDADAWTTMLTPGRQRWR